MWLTKLFSTIHTPAAIVTITKLNTEVDGGCVGAHTWAVWVQTRGNTNEAFSGGDLPIMKPAVRVRALSLIRSRTQCTLGTICIRKADAVWSESAVLRKCLAQSSLD